MSFIGVPTNLIWSAYVIQNRRYTWKNFVSGNKGQKSRYMSQLPSYEMQHNNFTMSAYKKCGEPRAHSIRDSQLTCNVIVTFAKGSKLVTLVPNILRTFANVIFKYRPAFNVCGCRQKTFLPTKHLSPFPNSVHRLYRSYVKLSE